MGRIKDLETSIVNNIQQQSSIYIPIDSNSGGTRKIPLSKFLGSGDNTTASGSYAHAEGSNTTASGPRAHAEGTNSTAYGDSTHSEGFNTTAGQTDGSSSQGAHSEGISSTANNSAAHAEGHTTISSGSSSHSEGTGTQATALAAHSEGYTTIAGGQCAHAEGWDTSASAQDAHAEGRETIASGIHSHAEGYKTTAAENSAHAEGYNTTAGGDCSHAEGYNTTCIGMHAHTEGKSTQSNDAWAHAEGVDTRANGAASHAEGGSTNATQNYAHAEGYHTAASGFAAHAEGYYTTAEGYGSHATGCETIARTSYCVSIGKHNTGSENKYFIIGNGSSDSTRKNAFSVDSYGAVRAASTITASTNADYAEYFEWADGNPNNEDRVGKFVTLVGDKIKIASYIDEYILGVVSGSPFVLGNGDCDVWNGIIMRDNFGRQILEPAQKLELVEVKDEDGNIQSSCLQPVVDEEGNPVYEGSQQVINPEYDNTRTYIPRSERPEWAPIGMLGVLSVYDGGTCEVNSYCKCGEDGIAWPVSEYEKGSYRVIKRVSHDIIRIVFR